MVLHNKYNRYDLIILTPGDEMIIFDYDQWSYVVENEDGLFIYYANSDKLNEVVAYFNSYNGYTGFYMRMKIKYKVSKRLL